MANYNNLPKFDIVSTLAKISSLKDAGVDDHIPSNINFNYYSNEDFRNNQEIKKIVEQK